MSSKRRFQYWEATLKFLFVLAIIFSIAYCLGVLTGFFFAPQRVEYIPVNAEHTLTAEVVQNEKPHLNKENLPSARLHGNCRITTYCSCEICCGQWALNRPTDEEGNPIVYGSCGAVLTSGVSVAASLPYGTKLIIDGLPGVFVVEDRTAEWIQDKYNGMVIDIYMDDHQSCYDLLSGKPEWMNVYIVEG